MPDDQLLISELAERAGVSVRTIRFYISEGLLPPPQAHGRISVYDEDYLTRIELIKLLKNAYLPLKEIKRMVESLSKEEIESTLHKLSTPSPFSPPAPAPATETFQMEETSAPSVGAPPNSTGIKEGGLSQALDYISRVLKSQSTSVGRSVPPLPAAAPPLSAPVNQPGRLLMQARAGIPEAHANASLEAVQPEEGESSWRRYTIQPGVELLVSEQVYNQSASSMRRIVARVKQLFSTHSSGG